MSSCHHAIKDFCMNHKDKTRALVGRRRVPCWLSKKMQSIPVCLGSKEGRGDEGSPPTRAAVLVQPPAITRRDFGAGPGPPP